MTPDIIAAVTPVVEQLDALGVRCHIGGSIASSVHGVPRATLDVDLVADLPLRAVAPFVRALEGAYYVDANAVRTAVKRRLSFNVIHLATMLKVDVFVLKDRPFERTAFARAAPDTLEDEPGARTFLVATAEDTVMHKLHWFRLGGEVSERQWGDVLGVLKVQAPTIDRGYLARWADELGLRDLLDRALAAAGLDLAPERPDRPA